MNRLKTIIIGAASALLVACGTLTIPNTPNVINTDIKGLRQIDTTVFSSGQPTKEQLTVLSSAGITDIINLRPASEIDWNEGEFVTQLGMQYHSIPIAGGVDITNANATLLQQKLLELSNKSVLVHCSSGNRVGSLISIDQYMSKQKSVEVAIKEGQRWGLTSNEAAVREILKTMESQQ